MIYVAHLEAAIFVLHAFQKKAQKTAQRDLDRDRLKSLAEER